MTKEQLRSYRDIRLERDKLEKLIEELEATMYSPATSNTDGTPRGSSEPGRPTESAAVKHTELLERYKQKEAELAEAMLDIEKAISTLEPRERTLMRLYYIEGLTWEEVAVSMSYSWRQVHRIHGAALEALKNKEKESTQP